MSPTTKQKNMYYCSDPEYDSDLDEYDGSEQNPGQEESDRVFIEDELDNYDGDTVTRNYESRSVVPEKPPSNRWKMSDKQVQMHMASILLEIKRDEMERRQLDDRRAIEKMFAQERLELIQEETRLVQENIIEMEKNKKINEAKAEWYEYKLACANGECVDEEAVVVKKVSMTLPTTTAAKAKAHKIAEKEKQANRKAPKRKKVDESTPEFKEQIKKMEMQQAIARASRQKTAQRVKRVAEAARALKFSLMTQAEIRAANETKNEYIMPRCKQIKDDDDIEDEEETGPTITTRFYEETIKEVKEKVIDDSVWTTVGRVAAPLIIKMGAAPYRPIMAPVQDSVRNEAFAKLADVKKIGAQLTFTRMCDSVASGKACRHGAKCNFAHTLDQLQIGQCAFADQCRLVSCKNTWYSNCNKKVCRFQHTGETKENVLKRNGAVVPKVTPPVVTPVVTPVAVVAHSVIIAPAPRVAAWTKPIAVAPIAVVVAPKGEKKVCSWYAKGSVCPHGVKCRFSHNTPVVVAPVIVAPVVVAPKIAWSKPPVVVAPVVVAPVVVAPKIAWSKPPVVVIPVVVAPVVVAPVVVAPLIIIRVPAELAMQALEMMLKQGKTNVKIEIV